MTPPRSKPAGPSSVQHVELPDGSHSIGCEIGGHFIAFAKLEPATVASMVERAENLKKLDPSTGKNGSAA